MAALIVASISSTYYTVCEFFDIGLIKVLAEANLMFCVFKTCTNKRYTKCIKKHNRFVVRL